MKDMKCVVSAVVGARLHYERHEVCCECSSCAHSMGGAVALLILFCFCLCLISTHSLYVLPAQNMPTTHIQSGVKK